ncbi:MAG: SGNH/GDSL hydrolase family protein [Chloroflexi bacterium]|nr:SGNH/GDSL hydrolase family protein [Chloroflexota bacterium]
MKSGHIKDLGLIALGVGLLSSVFFNIVLFQQGDNYYKELNAVRLNPLGLDAYPIQTPVSIDKPILVFFGDSRAFAWTPPENVPFQIVNRGIGAQTSAQVAARFDAHVAPLRPRVVVVQVGINDLKTIPLFPERKDNIIANCKANIKRIVDQAVAQNATVILTTIFPSGQVPLERRLFWSDDVAKAIADVNAYIRSLASERVIVFDGFAILANGEGVVRSEYRIDLLHINQGGYAALNVELERLLVTLAK